MNMIGIDTTRYSTVVRAFAEKYPNAIARLDKKKTVQPLDNWCTNKELLNLIDFTMTLNGREILSFHDHPREMMAGMDQIDFVQELEARKLLRYQILKEAEKK